MKLINIDECTGFTLSDKATIFLLKEYPPEDFDEMYDFDNDMCLDNSDYDEVLTLLYQKKLMPLPGDN